MSCASCLTTHIYFRGFQKERRNQRYFEILQELMITNQKRCPRKYSAVGIDKKNQFYFQTRCRKSDSSGSEEEFQHTNFAHARFSEEPAIIHFGIYSSGSNVVSKIVRDTIRRKQHQKRAQ